MVTVREAGLRRLAEVIRRDLQRNVAGVPGAGAAGGLGAGLMAFAGGRLRRRKSRTYCLVAAGIACMFMPFGTVLGIFTIITLTKPSVIQLFEGHGGYGGPL